MNITENKIALKSKAWLTKALLDLMAEKPLREISITEIAQNADLSRKTFYRLFDSKEDILCSYIKNIWDSNLENLYASPERSYFSTIKWYLTTWYEHRDFVILLYKNNLYSLLQQEYNQLFKEVYLARKADFPLAKQPEAMKYALSYAIGGSLNILWQWAEEGMTKTPDEVYALLLTAFEHPL